MSEPGTPLPWNDNSIPGQLANSVWTVETDDHDPTLIASTQPSHFKSSQASPEKASQNAAYIVEACNAYPQLRDALRKLVDAAKLKEYDQETDGIDGTVLYCSECGERKYGLLRHKKHCPYAAAIAEAERLLGKEGE